MTELGSMEAAIRGAASGRTPWFAAASMLERSLWDGCGDNSCRYKRPAGMATNGGCRCCEKIEDALRAACLAGMDEATR